MSENVVSLNVVGREPRGVVSTREYAPLRSEISEALVQLVDPANGLRVNDNVYEADAIYDGPLAGSGPDIVLNSADGYEFTPDVAYEGRVFVDVSGEGRGIHNRKGMLVLSGAGVHPVGGRTEARIVDVAPTALYLLGLPVPVESDGRVLDEVLSPEWMSARPPERAPLADLVPDRPAFGAVDAPNADQRVLEERLASLGYVE